MTRSQLLELIAHGENSGVEFKRDDLRPEQLGKEIVALANFQGGRILIGVDDDGAITGIRRDDLEHWVMDAVFGRRVHPMILPFYEEVQVDERMRVAVITIAAGTAKPYVVRRAGRKDVYVRVGSTSRMATREQLVRLFQHGGMLHAERLPVSGSGLRDLNRGRVGDHLLTILGDRELPDSVEAWHERLCGLGFMVEHDAGPVMCTIAGLVLFGLSPRRLLRQAGVRWMAFREDVKAYNALDDQVFDGPLVARRPQGHGGKRGFVEDGLTERLASAMRPFASEEASEIDEAMRRVRRFHYPPEAIREAVVNALAHRDWTRNEEIEVALYGNRIEVTSPGGLPNTMTVDKMIAGQRSPRNPLIVDILRDHGYVDARGMGVRNKIIPLLAEHNGTAPDFEATEDYLRVVMHRGRAAMHRGQGASA